MLPIAAHYIRQTTEEQIHSALPTAPTRPAPTTSSARRRTASPARDRLAAALRRAADRLEPTTW